MSNSAFIAEPRIVCLDTPVTVILRPQHAEGLREGVEYTVSFWPLEGYGGFRAGGGDPVHSISVPARDGALSFHGTFAGEQEYLIHVADGSADVGDARLYVLADDLFALRPWRGDLHMHSSHSDGIEPPAEVAAHCRRIGLDFMAVTDHWRYAPSLLAQQAFADLPIDLRIYPGEEIHFYPYSPVHLINFGGAHSVNALMGGEELPPGARTAKQSCGDDYLAAVQAIATEIDPAGMSEMHHFQYAQCLWVYREVRKAGGLAVFCHPYWFECRWYNVAEPLIARHFAEVPFDAYEIIGGYHRFEVESNALQVARYHEERAAGRILPIVGSSDSHGCLTGALFGWYSTIVFAPSAVLSDLIAGVKSCQAVAVETLSGEAPRIHGPFRLVKYAHFLLREVFPEHDVLCAAEGDLMLAHLAGETAAGDDLTVCQGQVQRLYTRLWA